jgi:hypothetical protein
MYTGNMSSNKIYFILGILIIVVPFSGLTVTVETVIFVVIGLVLMVTAFLSSMKKRAQQLSEREDARAYVENSEV